MMILRGHTPSSSTPGARRACGTNLHRPVPRPPGGVSMTMRLGRAGSGSWRLRPWVPLLAAVRGSKTAKESVDPGTRRSRAGCELSITPGLVPWSCRGAGRREGPGANDIASRRSVQMSLYSELSHVRYLRYCVSVQSRQDGEPDIKYRISVHVRGRRGYGERE